MHDQLPWTMETHVQGRKHLPDVELHAVILPSTVLPAVVLPAVVLPAVFPPNILKLINFCFKIKYTEPI
jgi:hypothetical protein